MALCGKLEKLQSTRRAKLNKASNLRKIVEELMPEKDYEPEVKCTFAKFVALCDEAKSSHNSLMSLLHSNELERQETWFKANIIINNDLINDVQKWLTHNVKNEKEVIDDILPEDSVSNAASTHSSRQSSGSRKSRSSTASAHFKAEAERAALVLPVQHL